MCAAVVSTVLFLIVFHFYFFGRNLSFKRKVLTFPPRKGVRVLLETSECVCELTWCCVHWLELNVGAAVLRVAVRIKTKTKDECKKYFVQHVD